jgi:hypothetical protein
LNTFKRDGQEFTYVGTKRAGVEDENEDDDESVLVRESPPVLGRSAITIVAPRECNRVLALLPIPWAPPVRCEYE